MKSNIRPTMESLESYSDWAARSNKGATLTVADLKKIRHFCVEVLHLKETLENFSSSWMNEKRAEIFEAEEVLSAIDQLITYDGNIKNDASETLYNLSKSKDDLAKSIRKTLDKIVKDNSLDNVLQDRYLTNREGRWVLPIKGGMQHNFKGIIHDSSQSKQTVFMEPNEIVASNNKLREVENEIEEEIQRLLKELSEYIHSKKEGVFTAKNILLEFDVVLAQAQFSHRIDARPAELSDGIIDLKGLKHPILFFDQSDVIGNSVELDGSKRTLILSGPNAGGKTVLLKSIGLAAQMARCGLPICAQSGSRIPFFNNISVSVGDSQSIQENLSTFAAHLKILNQATEYKGNDTLLLVDEICNSTDPEEGTALARSFIEFYSKNKIFSVITSHFSGLKTGWSEDCGVINGSLEFDVNKGPTYQFFMGVPGQSLALQTAQRVGVKKIIIDKAIKHLSPDRKKYEKGIADLENLREQMQTSKKEYDKKLSSTEKTQKKYEELISALNNKKNSLIKESVEKAEEKIEKLIKLSRARDSFQKHSDLEKIKMQLPDIIPSKKTVTQVIEDEDSFQKNYPPGSKVFIESLGREGVVQGELNSQGEVEVLSQSMRLKVPWNQIKPSATTSSIKKFFKKPHQKFNNKKDEESIDLRGLKLEDALLQIETELDQAVLQDQDQVKIIHGHGSEVLKRNIRRYLSESKYVKKWHTGDSFSGGDGVTWAELKD